MRDDSLKPPFKRLRRFSKKRTTYRFPSLKMRRMVYCESRLERDLAFWLERNWHVRSYWEQALLIRYLHDGMEYKHFPDFIAEVARGWIVIEVKPLKDVSDPDNQRNFRYGRLWCRDKGHRYHVMTENQICRQPYLRNLKYLYRYAKQRVPLEYVLAAREALRLSGHALSIRVLAARISHVDTRRDVGGQPNALDIGHQSTFKTGHLVDLTLSAD